MEGKSALPNKTRMQILFGMGFVIAAGALARIEIMCVVGCFMHCESGLAGIMFSQFNKVIHIINGES